MVFLLPIGACWRARSTWYCRWFWLEGKLHEFEMKNVIAECTFVMKGEAGVEGAVGPPGKQVITYRDNV